MSEHENAATPERKHSRFGGSIIGRVIACPGSVALCGTVPKPPESSYAREGTNAHSLAEYCLREGERDALSHAHASLPFGEGTDGWIVSKEMAQAVQVYLDAVYEELDASPDAELYVEQKFTFALRTAEEGEVFGANDALVYTPSKGRLVVFDYKHGAGVSVSAEDNAQLKFYAAGACLSHPDWPIREVELVVVQPRSRDAEENNGGVKPWPMDPIDLIEFSGVIEDAVQAAKAEEQILARGSAIGLNLKAGSHCRWCPAAAVCPAKEKDALQSVGLDFATVVNITPSVLPKPAELDTARLARVAAGAKVLSDWAAQVQEYIFGLLQQGVPVPGFKLVEKVARRQWIDSEEEIAAYLTVMHGVAEDDARPRTLVTITEAERLLKGVLPSGPARKEALDELSLKYTVKDSSGLTIAPESDKRPAVDAAARDFGAPVQL